MSLTLHFHPLSSFCHKALIALYENDTPFERRIVNLMDPAEAAAFKKLWPCGKFPVLQDGNRTIPESSVIIEHLDLQHPGKTRFIPAAPTLFYVDKLFPLAGTHKNAARYLDRLLERPSYARVIEEAKPYLSMFPI